MTMPVLMGFASDGVAKLFLLTFVGSGAVALVTLALLVRRRLRRAARDTVGVPLVPPRGLVFVGGFAMMIFGVCVLLVSESLRTR